MTAVLRRLDPWPTLRGAPIALPQLLALVALVTLSAAEGGFPLEHWAPAAVLVALLLAVALFSLPAGARRPAGSRLAILLVTGFALWTVASIGWADDQGAAAIAATRTGLLAATFVLFARWRHAPRTASLLLTVLAAGLGIFAWGVLLQLHGTVDFDRWFLYDRLLEPVGYVNAGAAFWGVAAFLGTALLGGGLPAPHRIVGALVAVPAASLSLLCLSRGGLLATGIVVILLLALLPGRARNGAAFGIVGLGVLFALPSLLDVGDAVRFSTDAATVLHGAITRVYIGTALAVVATGAWIAIERSLGPGDPTRARAARVGGAGLGVVAAVAVVLAVAGVGPVTVDTIRDGASSITRSYDEQGPADNRLSAGLGSGRWAFWTVAWDQFSEAPVLGAGADNYRQDYLLRGDNPENPRYPHSLWLRALGQLGLVGGLLLLGFVAVVAAQVRRLGAAPDPAGRAVALAGGGVFGLWVVHGSADWLLEFGGLSAIVAAVAGLVIAAAPDARIRLGRSRAAEPAGRGELAGRAEPADRGLEGERTGETAARGRRVPSLGAPAGILLLAVLAVWSASQWVADRDRTAATILAADQPQRALDRAERAAALDPFGDQADLVLGALAVRRGDLPAAQAAYTAAYARNPRATRPRMWIGVLASAAGDARGARRWLRRAARTAPRDAVVTGLAQQVAAGAMLDPEAVQRQLSDQTAALIRDPDPAPRATPPAGPGTTPSAAPPTPAAPPAGTPSTPPGTTPSGAG